MRWLSNINEQIVLIAPVSIDNFLDLSLILTLNEHLLN